MRMLSGKHLSCITYKRTTLTLRSALAALEDAGDVSSPPPVADDSAANTEAKASE
jgi:hypothetical protein